MAQSFDSSRSRRCKRVLRRALKSYYYHTACLLGHYGLDSVFEYVDVRTEWMVTLELITRIPNVLQDIMASAIVRAETGQTLLSLAALFRHKEAFRVFLDLGVDPACPAICEVQHKLSTVVPTGHSMSGQETLDGHRKSNQNKMSDELRQGPLAWAAYTGNLSLVQSILDRGLDPNIKNSNGQTALYFAVQQTEDRDPLLEVDKEAIVRLLLQKGALVTSADAYSGTTVLASAFEARYSRVARILLEMVL